MGPASLVTVATIAQGLRVPDVDRADGPYARDGVVAALAGLAETKATPAGSVSWTVHIGGGIRATDWSA